MSGDLSLSQVPQILCIDDDPDVLDGLQLSLRRQGEVHVAPDGNSGLILAAQLPRLAVVICDMRMPDRSGADVLAVFSERHPEVTRILLTGYADLPSAIAAVNQGHIFRFLSKPTSAEILHKAVSDGVAQYRLVIAERQLLEQTVRGSVAALSEALALASPAVFGQARRVRNLLRDCLQILHGQGDWMLESAAFLINLGLVALPWSVQEKILNRHPLSDEEAQQLDKAHLATMTMLNNIPRLEALRDVLRLVEPKVGGQMETPPAEHPALRERAELLRSVIRYVSYESSGFTVAAALQRLHEDWLLPASWFAALEQTAKQSDQVDCQVSLPLNLLRPGMVLNKAIYTPSGILVAPAGYQLSEGFTLRLMALLPNALSEVFPVRVPAHLSEYADLLKWRNE